MTATAWNGNGHKRGLGLDLTGRPRIEWRDYGDDGRTWVAVYLDGSLLQDGGDGPWTAGPTGQHNLLRLDGALLRRLRRSQPDDRQIWPRQAGLLDRTAAALPVPWRALGAVAEETTEWLVYPLIPLGALTLIAGDPGVGKGYVVTSVAAGVTVPVPVLGQACLPHGTVLWAAYEDSPGKVLRRRLRNQRGDPDKVLLLDQWPAGPGRHRQMRPNDVAVLDEVLDDVADARALIIDPAGSFVGGGTDTHRDNEVRDVLQPLVDLAEHHNVAVIVVCHLNKAELLKAIYRVSGSIGFAGIARSVLAVGKDEETGRRAVAHAKANLGPLGPTQEFRIVAPARLDEVATLEWVGEAADLTVERLLGNAPRTPGPDPDLRDACAAAIGALLDAGPRPAEECKDCLERGDGFSEATVRRAKKALGVICDPPRKGEQYAPGESGYRWRLP